MADWLISHEPMVRLGCFLAVLAAMALWERIAPRRSLALPRSTRWFSNLGLMVLGSLAARLLVPVAATGVALFAARQDSGLFNQVAMPGWVALVVSVVVLDAAIYLQHLMFHAVPILWRLHLVHHADVDFDTSTGVRFHPVEILLSLLIKFAVILLLGPPVAAVILFEVLLNATALFNHGNVRLPRALDRRLRWLVVTPDMHRVHHSVHSDETNSNFGFNLPWWDRLCGTYRDQPRDGHTGMVIGLHAPRGPRQVACLPGMLWLPLLRAASGYGINRGADR
jgi:sterol desaturase/sphingolipid hydroxylase (fatty acid hydroxylase superfamily)